MKSPGNILKVNLHRELNHARPCAGRSDSTEGGRDCDVAVRVRKVRNVENIEELRPKLRANRFCDRDKFDDGKIHVLLSRPAKYVSPGVAEPGRRDERSRIEKFIQAALDRAIKFG